MLGYCTAPNGDAVQYVLTHGLPEWSREHMTGLARCGGASATSETTDGRGEGHGSGELHVHSSDRGGDAGASPADPMATVRPGVDLSAGGVPPDGVGREDAAARLLFFAGVDGHFSEWPGVSASRAVIDDDERTEVGSQSGDSKKPKPGGGAMLLPVPDPACRKVLPPGEVEVRRLSQLRADELADHLGELALRQAPLVSPRLEAVLREHAVFAADCPQGYPDTLAKAAFALDDDAFGRATGKVVHSCIALWQDISAAEARVQGCRASQVTAARAAHPDRAGMAVARCLPAPEPQLAPPDDEAWALVAPASTVRGQPLPRSAALGRLHERGELVSSEAIELNERHIAGAQLLAVWPDYMHHLIVGLTQEEFDELSSSEPMRVEGLFRAHFGSFTAGSISGCRRAVTRLIGWLGDRCLSSAFSGEPPWLTVSGGMLSLFVQDMQQVSRNGSQGGQSVPAALKAGLVWGVARAGLSGLTVYAQIFLAVAAPQSSRPRQALSLSVRALAQFRWLRVHHESELVRLYAAGFELLCVASLRMRDAQRALLSYQEAIVTYGDSGGKVQDRVGFVRGKCFTSKHPKRRANKQKLFFGPKRAGKGGEGPDGYVDVLVEARERLGGTCWDYIFPRVAVPRGGSLASGSAKLLAGPAPSAEAIRNMRGLLLLPPLSLTLEQAALFSGHSGRHLLVTFAKAVASVSKPPRYSDDELALLGDWADGARRRGSACVTYIGDHTCHACASLP